MLNEGAAWSYFISGGFNGTNLMLQVLVHFLSNLDKS
jgi:hypothetical protein